LLHGATDPQELAHFIEGPAEACCRGNISEPMHGFGALCDATVILLKSIVKLGVTAVDDVTDKRLVECKAMLEAFPDSF